MKLILSGGRFLSQVFPGASLIDTLSLKKEFKGLQFNWSNTIALSSSATSQKYKICLFDATSIKKEVLATKDILRLNPIFKAHYDGHLKHLLVLPLYHIFGLIAVYFWFALFSRTFVLCESLDKETLVKTIKRHEVTHIFGVPLLWETLAKAIKKEFASLDEASHKRLLKGLKISRFLQNNFGVKGTILSRRILKEVLDKVFGTTPICFISGGGPIRSETLSLINEIGYPLFNGYGATEIGITSLNTSRFLKKRTNGSIGRPLPGINYRIDEDGNLEVKALSLAKKIILEDEEITPKEYFNTFDYAKEIKGEYFLLGRSDDVILSENGEKLSLDELEKEIHFSFDLSYSLLNLDERLTLAVELVNFDKEKLEELNKEIESAKKVLINLGARSFTAKFTSSPLLSADAFKVSRKELEKRIKDKEVVLKDLSRYATDEYEETPLTLFLKEKVSEVLDIEKEKILVDSNFIFDLGGTSIEYLTLLEKINEKYPLNFQDFEEKQIFTIREFEAYLNNLDRNE